MSWVAVGSDYSRQKSGIGRGSRRQRLFASEKRHWAGEIELDDKVIAALERNNPCYRERHIESSRPGELLSVDTSKIGELPDGTKITLHAVVDTYGSYGFGLLHSSKQPEASALLLHNDVLPFYAVHALTIETILSDNLSDNGREFCGTPAHPYELFLALNDIEHRRTPVKRPQANGFVERFIRTAKEEFFAIAFGRRTYTTIDELQTDFDA